MALTLARSLAKYRKHSGTWNRADWGTFRQKKKNPKCFLVARNHPTKSDNAEKSVRICFSYPKWTKKKYTNPSEFLLFDHFKQCP